MIKKMHNKKKDRCGLEPAKCIEISLALLMHFKRYLMHYQISFVIKVVLYYNLVGN